jgi:TolB protein
MRGFYISLAAVVFFLMPLDEAESRIIIDVNAPFAKKFTAAIPDFRNDGSQRGGPELGASLAGVIASDLDLSGYFTPMDKGAFLEGNKDDSVDFKSWSVIGAELLVKGSYTLLAQSLEVELKVYDIYWGKQIFGKRAVGETHRQRELMHRLSNDIIRLLTGSDGIALTKLAFSGDHSGAKELYMSDYDGANAIQLTSDKSIVLSPRWSPDGKRILYNSYKDNKGPKLYMKDLSTGAVRTVSGRPGLNIGAAFSPDGARLALTLTEKGDSDIFLIDLNGNVIKNLTDHWAIDVSPSFSPDGSRMAFVSNRAGTPQIYVMTLADGSVERITFDFKYCTSPAWSSRNRIAFAAMEGGVVDIYTVGPDGRNIRRVTSGTGNNEDPCWSPDGRYLAFASNRGGRYNIYLSNEGGDHQRQLTRLSGNQRGPSWAP